MHPTESETDFSDVHFAEVARLSQDLFGIHLPISKKPLVYSRLAKRLKENGMKDFSEYIRYVSSSEGSLEKISMLSALTTNVTSFFREKHHFDYLVESSLPELIQYARSGGRVRFWSAGCSSGPEAYSLAMCVLDLCPEAASLDIRILATDIDPAILKVAEQGRYRVQVAKHIPESFMRFTREVKGNGSVAEIEILSPAKEIISFKNMNLVGDWPISGKFSAILCRNVAIYFDNATQQALWQKFYDALNPNGLFFSGHSERLTGSAASKFSVVPNVPTTFIKSL